MRPRAHLQQHVSKQRSQADQSSPVVCAQHQVFRGRLHLNIESPISQCDDSPRKTSPPPDLPHCSPLKGHLSLWPSPSWRSSALYKPGYGNNWPLWQQKTVLVPLLVTTILAPFRRTQKVTPGRSGLYLIIYPLCQHHRVRK